MPSHEFPRPLFSFWQQFDGLALYVDPAVLRQIFQDGLTFRQGAVLDDLCPASVFLLPASVQMISNSSSSFSISGSTHSAGWPACPSTVSVVMFRIVPPQPILLKLVFALLSPAWYIVNPVHVRYKSIYISRSSLNTQFNTPPTPKAKGNINATMYNAALNPRSFTIMKKFAMQGTNRVITVRLTTI